VARAHESLLKKGEEQAETPRLRGALARKAANIVFTGFNVCWDAPLLATQK
jgi:hypothetical protein